MNLTRMGDLVQTTPAMAGLKAEHPQARITLFVNSEFAEVCRLIPHADRVIALDLASLKKMLADPGRSFVDCYRRLEEVLSEVNDTEYDLALNLTHSTESAHLASLLRAGEVRGLVSDAEGNRVIRHPWLRYLFHLVSSRGHNPFHLCDIYAKAACASPQPRPLHLEIPEETVRRAETLLREAGAAPDEQLVAFQLGASHPLKRWPVASFAACADRLAVAVGARAVLVGAQGDAELGREFERAASAPVVNLIGRTGLGELAGVFRRCRLLISNDTGPLHVAAAAGTRVIDVSLAHVCFRETGPYGEGHFVVEAEIPCAPCAFHVECRAPACKELVTPEAVAELARRILCGERVEPLEDAPPWRGLQVYRSGFGEDGLLDYRPLVRRLPRPEAAWSRVYRRTWPGILDGLPGPDPARARIRFGREMGDHYGMEAKEKLEGLLAADLEPLRRMRVLTNEALRRVSLIAKEAAKDAPDTLLVKTLWSGVPAVEAEIEMIGRTRPHLWPPVAWFRLDQEAMEGEGLAAVASESVAVYSRLADHLGRIEALVGFPDQCRAEVTDRGGAAANDGTIRCKEVCR